MRFRDTQYLGKRKGKVVGGVDTRTDVRSGFERSRSD